MQYRPSALDLPSLAAALGGEIRNGQVVCPGPGHSTIDRSLSVKVDPSAPDGFVAYSFANDDPIRCRDHIRRKLGLPAFKANGNGHVRRRTDQEIERGLLAAIKRQPAAIGRRIVCSYPYSDENGTLLYEVVRYEPKGFAQRRPDVRAGWTYSLGDVRRVLYRLSELLAYPDGIVFITEGEKDADRVAALGSCATTVASGRWEGVDVAVLKGRDCIILEDADAAGEKKALKAATALHGTTKSIRIVRLPGLTGEPHNKDASDWLDADHRRAEKLVEICFDTSVWDHAPDHDGDHAQAPAESSPEMKADGE